MLNTCKRHFYVFTISQTYAIRKLKKKSYVPDVRVNLSHKQTKCFAVVCEERISQYGHVLSGKRVSEMSVSANKAATLSSAQREVAEMTQLKPVNE